MTTILALLVIASVIAGGARWRRHQGVPFKCDVCGHRGYFPTAKLAEVFSQEGVDRATHTLLDRCKCRECGAQVGHLVLESSYVALLIEKLRMHEARLAEAREQAGTLQWPGPVVVHPTPEPRITISNAFVKFDSVGDDVRMTVTPVGPVSSECAKCVSFFGPGATCVCVKPQQKIGE